MSNENGYKKLDFNKLNFSGKVISTEEALKDVILMYTDDEFKQFLREHKETIDRITPKNPTIGLDDEWRDKEYDDV